MAAKSPTQKDLAAKLAELEKKLVTRERVEEIAAASALDVLKFYESEVKKATQAAEEVARGLEKREFARRVAASLEDRACRRAIDELVMEVIQDELDRVLEGKVGEALAVRLAEAESAGGSEEVSKQLEQASKRLAERLDRIEREALPQLVEKQLDQKVGQKLEESLDAVPAGTIVEPVDEELDGDALREKVIEVARSSVREIVNTAEFKGMLDEKFKVMMNYLTKDVIPKQVRRLMGG